MSSAFLVFGLIGGNAGLERERNARSAIHPELNDREEAVGLVVGEESEASSDRQSFAKGDGAHQGDFVAPVWYQCVVGRRIRSWEHPLPEA